MRTFNSVSWIDLLQKEKRAEIHLPSLNFLLLAHFTISRTRRLLLWHGVLEMVAFLRCLPVGNRACFFHSTRDLPHWDCWFLAIMKLRRVEPPSFLNRNQSAGVHFWRHVGDMLLTRRKNFLLFTQEDSISIGGKHHVSKDVVQVQSCRCSSLRNRSSCRSGKIRSRKHWLLRICHSVPIQDVLLSKSESHSLEWKESNEALGKDGFVERMVDSALKGEIYQNILPTNIHQALVALDCVANEVTPMWFFLTFWYLDPVRNSTEIGFSYSEPIRFHKSYFGDVRRLYVRRIDEVFLRGTRTNVIDCRTITMSIWVRTTHRLPILLLSTLHVYCTTTYSFVTLVDHSEYHLFFIIIFLSRKNRLLRPARFWLVIIFLDGFWTPEPSAHQWGCSRMIRE